jgi:hypothetical protein
MLGSAIGLAGALGSALSGGRLNIASPQIQTASTGGKGRGKSKGVARDKSFWRRPVWTTSRKDRNPSDPAQAYLIARAEAKRARRAEKLTRDICRAFRWDRTNDGRPALNPFYNAQ